MGCRGQVPSWRDEHSIDMDELLKAFKDFITRDFAYVICGSFVLAYPVNAHTH